MRVLEMAGWPPQGGAGEFDPRAESFKSYPELVTIRKVDRIINTRVDMTCIFSEGLVTFRYYAPDRGTAETMAAIIEQNRGKSIDYVGTLDFRQQS
jgi:hypothetical protein